MLSPEGPGFIGSHLVRFLEDIDLDRTRSAGLAGRGKSRTACETREQLGHRDSEAQRFVRFLCVSVTPWQTSLCLAARADFHDGLPDLRAVLAVVEDVYRQSGDELPLAVPLGRR